MRTFEFYYDGEFHGDGTYTSGLKKLSGEPVDIGRAMGTYADAAMKQKNVPQVAMIIINAYHQFKKLNPDLSRDIENHIASMNGGIIRPDNW